MAQCFSYLRMSTPEQLKGDSLRRQVAQARDYAQKNGLTFVDDLRDVGVSAFKGRNVGADAALGRFLQAVRDDKIERGSVLLIENVDRISRQPVSKSIALFTEILNAGLVVVTLEDGRKYTEDSDVGEFIVTLVTMGRAHDESRVKSHRTHAFLLNARRMARETGKVMTWSYPSWLKPKPNGVGFDVVPDRVKTIKLIFEHAVERNLGADAIMRVLNKDKVPTFGRSRGWGRSSIYKILRNRALIGEHRPLVNGQPGPDEEIIHNYFPKVIEEGLFFRAQEIISKRRYKGGRKGVVFSNILSGIAVCGVCGGKMKHRSVPVGRILYCDTSDRKLGCEATATWRYGHLEASLLRFVAEIDLAAILGKEDETGELRQVEVEIEAVEGKLADTRKRRQRTFDLLTGDEATPFLRTQFDELDGAVRDLEKKLSGLQIHLKSLTAGAESAGRLQEEILELVEHLQGMTGDEAFRTRAAIAARLREVVEVVEVFTGARAPGGGSAGKIPRGRKFIVRFKNGEDRTVYPDKWSAKTAYEFFSRLEKVEEPTAEAIETIIDDLIGK